MKIEGVLRLLRRRCSGWGGQSDLARQMDVAPQYISLVLNGQRPPSPRLLEALGLEEVRTYRPRQPPRNPVRNNAAAATVARPLPGNRTHAKQTRPRQPVD